MTRLTLTTLTAALLLSACCAAKMPDEKERGALSTRMVNLSSDVEGYFAEAASAPAASDAEILKAATRRHPSDLAPEFEPYTLKVQYQNPFAVVLLCTKDGKRAIMEDAGCSARLDRQVVNPAPCEFTLRVSQGCQVQGADPQ